MTADFTLYHLASCPYCIRVRWAADQMGVRLNLVDISQDPVARKKLIDFRGRPTVPVLDTGDGLLGESRDIVAFLEKWAARAA